MSTFSQKKKIYIYIFCGQSALANSGVSSPAPPCARLCESRQPRLRTAQSPRPSTGGGGGLSASSQWENKLGPAVLIGSGGVGPPRADTTVRLFGLGVEGRVGGGDRTNTLPRNWVLESRDEDFHEEVNVVVLSRHPNSSRSVR